LIMLFVVDGPVEYVDGKGGLVRRETQASKIAGFEKHFEQALPTVVRS
jgi:hypothetical protein